MCFRVSSHLAAFAALGALSCAPAADAPDGAKNPPALSRVEARGDAAGKLLALGGKLVADYGTYQLVDAPRSAVEAVPAEQVVARDDRRVIRLNAGPIDTAAEGARGAAGLAAREQGRTLHLVQFAGPVQARWHEALRATGVQIVAYVPENAYLVYGGTMATQALQALASRPHVQWAGPYLARHKVSPAVYAQEAEAYQVQLVEDEEANAETLASVGGERVLGPAGVDRSLGYATFVAYISRDAAVALAERPDVVSIHPWSTPRKRDERQDLIVSGFLDASGARPAAPGYLAWLAGRGFGPATFGFGVDVSDEGIDNGTLDPNGFALHELGDATAPGRILYARCEGTCTELRGCDGHGTLNAHIIGAYVGASRTGPAFRDEAGYAYGLGVAPWVKLGSSVIFAPGWSNPDYEDLQSRAYRDGARISSNPWGYTSGTSYTADSQRFDALVRDAQPDGSAVPAAGNQGMVILFPTGNSGSGSGTVHPPGTAKNVITVGATENYRPFGGADQCGVADWESDSAMDIASFSSRGPTLDGRKKPDLAAPGTHVTGGVFQATGQRAEPPANPDGAADACFNAASVCGGLDASGFFPAAQQWTTASSGTSLAVSAVAGAAALVRQWNVLRGRSDPSPALVKATLMSTARYLVGAGANDDLWSNAQGMGGADVGMAFDDVPKLVRDQDPTDVFTATGQTRVLEASVDDVTKPLRVTLAWTDAPGSTTGDAWNNDLDLTVSVGGATYRGNVFSGGSSVTGGTADFRNNVESVFLPAGVSGPFTVTVTASNINSDGIPNFGGALDQDYALYVYNACDQAPPAPTNLTAVASAPNVVHLTWDADDAPEHVVYRSTSAGGPYEQVGSTGAGASFDDTTVSGGVTYHYVVRGKLCGESPPSNEASITATGDCTEPPIFAGLEAATNAQQSTCTIHLSWPAATPVCGGTVTYDVYRSRTADFTPGVANRIVAGVTGTSFADAANLADGEAYHYVVRAVETAARAVEEQNTVRRTSSPTGVPAPAIDYFDDFDANRPANAAAYWRQFGTNLLGVVSGCWWQSPSGAYKWGALGACGGSYTNSANSTLSLGGDGTVDPAVNGFSFPAGATGTMTFHHWFSLENNWDGVRLLYSTTGAAGPWTYVTDTVSATAPFISAGGYTGTAFSAGGARVWTNLSGGTNGALRAVTVNLDALAGQTAWFAFGFTTDSSVTREGHYLDDVRIAVTQTGACSPGVVPPGPAASFAIDLPSSAQAGAATPFTVTAYDALEQVAAGYSGTADVSVSDPLATVSAPLAFTSGVASGSVVFGTIGSQTVTVADSAAPEIRGTASALVTPGAPAALRVETQPTEAVAGSALSPAVRVWIVDAFGNLVGTATDAVTLAIGGDAGGGTLSGTLTVAASGGVATFGDLSIDRAGEGYTLVATSGALTATTTAPLRILPDAPVTLAVVTQPTTTRAGVPMAPAVEIGIQDQFGNLTTSTADVTIALAGDAAGATLGGTLTVAAVGGVATFSDLWLDRAGGGYSLGASSGALAPVTTATFDVVPGDPHRIEVRTQPSDAAAGVTFSQPVVGAVLDEMGNLATQYGGPVQASLLGGAPDATLLGHTSVTASAGIATFADLAVDRAGTGYTLSLTSSGLLAGASASFDVTAGSPAALVFVGQPSDVEAGATLTPAVRVAIEDVFGNVVTTATDPVTLALALSPGGLGGTVTVDAAGGVATFDDLVVERSGTLYTLQATGAGLPPAYSTAFDVLPGAAASLEFSVQPSTAVAGAVLAPPVQVRALDAHGNVATGFAGAVSLALSSNPGGATLSGGEAVAAENGVTTFPALWLDRAGTGYGLTASAGGLPSVTSTAFDVTADAPAALAFLTQPVTVQAGAALPALTVELRDRYGNRTASTAEVLVEIATGPAGAALSGAVRVAAVAGRAEFSDLSLERAGTGYALSASSSALPALVSDAFDVTPGPAARLEITGLPERVDVDAVTTVSLAAYDAFGNLDVAYAATVALTSTDTAAVLPAAQLSAGVAPAVAVTFRSPGTQVLTATDAANATVSGSATTLVVARDAPPSSSDGGGCGCGGGAGSAGELALFLALGVLWRGFATRGRKETSGSGG